MHLKSILFIFVLLLSITVIGQTDSTQIEKRFYLKNLSNNRTSYSIKKWDEVKIWFKGVDEPVKGFVTYLNDSTLLMNETMVAIDMIEQIRITPSGVKFMGSVIVLVGSILTGGGIIIIANSKGAPGLSALFYYLVGGAATIIGAPTAILGTAVLFGNSKKYDLNEWEFQFKNKTN